MGYYTYFDLILSPLDLSDREDCQWTQDHLFNFYTNIFDQQQSNPAYECSVFSYEFEETVPVTFEEFCKKFGLIEENADFATFVFGQKSYKIGCDEGVHEFWIELSKKYPSKMLTLHHYGEDGITISRIYIKNGKYENAKEIKTYSKPTLE